MIAVVPLISSEHSPPRGGLRRIANALRGGRRKPAAAVRRAVEREFEFRGSTTLEFRSTILAADGLDLDVYARPLYLRDPRAPARERRGLFAEQLFSDAVRILHTAWRQEPTLPRIRLTIWIKPVADPSAEMQALSVGATRERAALLSLGGAALPPLAAIEILRRLRALARIDADGNFGEERPL